MEGSKNFISRRRGGKVLVMVVPLLVLAAFSRCLHNKGEWQKGDHGNGRNYHVIVVVIVVVGRVEGRGWEW